MGSALAALAVMVSMAVFVAPGAASAHPLSCGYGNYCWDASMLPITVGGGITTQATIDFHLHTADAAYVTLDGIVVDRYPNPQGDPVCYYSVQAREGTSVKQQGGPWRCNEFHNFSIVLSTANGVVQVWVAGSTSTVPTGTHSLAVRDFCTRNWGIF
jgi:hypothetical protein